MAAVAESTTIEPTPLQARALAVPRTHNKAWAGSRGFAKTFGMFLDFWRDAEAFGSACHGLYVRKSLKGLREAERDFRRLFRLAYGKALRYNAQEMVFTLPNGASLALDQLEHEDDWEKYQGKSFTMVMVDEAGQYASPTLVDQLHSCLRSAGGVPCRFALAANPGGPGHIWIQQRHLAGIEPWEPYVEPRTGLNFVTITGLPEDNPHLGADYPKSLQAATATDPEMYKAWRYGDWNIARGGYFAGVFDERRNVIEPWSRLPGMENEEGLTRMQEKWRIDNAESMGKRPNIGWETFIAADHGSAAPACFYLVARSPGATGPDGRFYPRDSLVLMDEVVFAERDDATQGLGLTVPVMTAEVIDRCKAWGMRAQGCLDDACFSNHGSDRGTLAKEYRSAGFNAQKVHKGDRISGWESMRRLMLDAGSPDKPGLYVSRRCQYWLQTVPLLPRDPRRPEDVDTKAADHAADATRYAVLFEQPRISVTKLRGF